MQHKEDIETKVQEKYSQAKMLAPADVKMILLGDSAVGKSK